MHRPTGKGNQNQQKTLFAVLFVWHQENVFWTMRDIDAIPIGIEQGIDEQVQEMAVPDQLRRRRIVAGISLISTPFIPPPLPLYKIPPDGAVRCPPG